MERRWLPISRLIRLLLRKFSDRPEATLSQVNSEIRSWTDAAWEDVNAATVDKFPPQIIKENLDEAIKYFGESATLAEVAKPVILRVHGASGDGKTTFSSILQDYRIPVVSTDYFVEDLGKVWCPDPFIRQLSARFFPGEISRFWLTMVNSGKTNLVVELFFDPVHGFKQRAEISIIEGYLPPEIEYELRQQLKQRGYWVWSTEVA